MHGGSEPRQMTIPHVVQPYLWRQFVNTAAESPADVYPDLDGPAPPPDGIVEMEDQSLLCYVARDEL